MMLSLDRLIEQALLEDIHTGDITTQAVVPGPRPASARLIAKEPLVLAGTFRGPEGFSSAQSRCYFYCLLCRRLPCVQG